MNLSSLTIQSVLFHTPISALERALSSIDKGAEVGRREGLHGLVEVAFGDCSPSPEVSESILADWHERFTNISTIRYQFFGENLGHGGAQNRIAQDTKTDLLVISNPDVLPSARSLGYLAEVLEDATVGIAEAKQLPLEHPKSYDRVSGATSWASGAFSMFRAAQFREVGGFDPVSFFMYGDDVDLSWRFRSMGFRVIFQPAATVFHDKRLNAQAEWLPTQAERYYSAESALLLAHKWSRDDILENLLSQMRDFPDETVRSAVCEFDKRKSAGSLPIRLDPDNLTAEFNSGNYAEHRW